MRILHCISGLHGGGAERQLSYLSAALDKKGVDVHVAYHLSEPESARILDSRVRYHILPSRGNHDALMLWRLIKVVREVQPDLIQTWLLQMDVVGGLAAIATRIPFVMTERTVAGTYVTSWKEMLRNAIGKRAALVIANSRSGRDYWLSRKPADLVRVVPNAVPVDEIQETPPVRSESGSMSEDSEIVLFAGRYSREKNVSVLLDALFLAVLKRPTLVALLFGEGPLKGALVEEVKRRRMEDRVRIMGYTQEVWGWMKRAAVLVSVSLFEGNPNVVAEAAAAGCPLVLSDIPQHRDLFGDDDACYVPCGAPQEIADGLLDVLRNPDKAKRKARSAHAKVSHRTIDSLANEYVELYSLILADLRVSGSIQLASR
jgi:glycosyltransferase involved in cell wall biosynthesis